MTKWIAREKRGGKQIAWRKYLIWLAVSMGILLLLVLLGGTIAKKISSIFSLKNNHPIASVVRRPVDADSFFCSIIVELGLDSAQLVTGSPGSEISGKRAFPRFQTKWPQAYPFIWFTRKLQIACRAQDSLRYDTIEMDDGKRLVASIIDNRDTLGQIELIVDNRCKPSISTAAVIFDNFGNMSKSQVISLAKLGIPFGYILAPDQIPDKDLGKILKTCRGECFLRFPTDKGSWAAIIKKLHLGNVSKTARPSDKVLETILQRFPVIDGFFFDSNSEVDKGIVKSLLTQASNLGLFYLNSEKTPGTIDSILAESGIKTGTPFKKVDLRGTFLPDFTARFKANFAIAAIRTKTVYFIDSRAEYIEALDSLGEFFTKWNVRIAPPSAQLDYSGNL
jgi:hypothetical protein